MKGSGEMATLTLDRKSGGKIEQAATRLRDEIVSGRRVGGSALPSHDDLSQRYKISPASARLVVSRLAREGLVLRIPGRGSFVQENVTPAQRTIDFVRPVEEPGKRKRLSTLAIIESFVRVCAERKAHPVWHHVLFREMWETENLADRLRHSQGVVALNPPLEFPRQLHRRGVPVISLMPQGAGVQLTPEAFPQITFDRRATVRGAVEHLADQGYRRIGFVGRRRMAEYTCGFLDGMQQRKLGVNLDWVLDSIDDMAGDVRGPLEAIFAGGERPEALCFATDHVAACVEPMLLDLGLRVPLDVALATGSDSPEAAQAAVPITAFGVEVTEEAKIALDALDRHVTTTPGVPGAVVELIVLPLRLKVRESCGAKLK